ncbi:MAG: hypothetical protein M1825_000441 [Sarcosagium campestre]|nr:MAG: hypothetical protein M1825_000441 [Sarcosagium campestre]
MEHYTSLSSIFYRERGPAPGEIKVSKLDFAKAGMSRYENLYAVVLDGVLSREECNAFISGAENLTNGEWQMATVNLRGDIHEVDESVRVTRRYKWPSQVIANRVWDRVKHYVPEIQEFDDVPRAAIPGGLVYTSPMTSPRDRATTSKVPALGGQWTFSRPNELIRVLRYDHGMFFRGERHLPGWLLCCSHQADMSIAVHEDGQFATNDEQGTPERSFFTLHLYLNSASGLPEDAGLTGGSTSFLDPFDSSDRLDVKPTTGRVLIFQQPGLYHAGDPVELGTKYTVRMDLLYKKQSPKQRNKDMFGA